MEGVSVDHSSVDGELQDLCRVFIITQYTVLSLAFYLLEYPLISSIGQQSQSVRDELAVAQHQDDAATSQLTPATQQSSRKPAKCRFFATKKGG